MDIFSNNTQISNIMKIRIVGAELFRSDRRTDMKLIVVFPEFCERAQKFSFRKVLYSNPEGKRFK